LISAERLAPGAEVTASVLDWYPLDYAAANSAGLAPSVSDLEFAVSGTCLTIREYIGIYAGTFTFYGRPQYAADALIQPTHLLGG